MVWLSEVGGDYQYGVSISATGPEEADSRFQELIGKNSLVSKSFSIRLEIVTFGHRMLAAANDRSEYLYQGNWQIIGQNRVEENNLETVVLDEKDLAILQLISIESLPSHRELARDLKLQPSMVDRRIKGLERGLVIDGYHSVINSELAGFRTYRLLVDCAGSSPALSGKLFRFVRARKCYTRFIRCLGQWDYELELAVGKDDDLSNARTEIYSKFGTEIKSIKLIPLLKNIACPMFPISRA